MSENETRDPGEAEGDGKAGHGYRNEVSWDGGKGAQPYSNQGTEEQGPATAKEYEGGDRGDASGRNLDQLEQAKGKPQRPVAESPRGTDGREAM
ncbi:MAG TPA: hypothetical protein VNB23_17025 [Ramlibacter sp.]|nr:hypothetical protein [Ramlibacter sp.]